MAEERVQRKLAAILVADVVGYSRLMGDDEAGTLSALTAHRTDMIDPCIADHGGRVFKSTGDGLLAEFTSVVDAVRCAIAFQEGIFERNASAPYNKRIEFRIGVNMGDVILQDDDLFGDGVNIAARLERLAKPGSVCVSDAVYQNVRAKLDISFEDLGLQRVKNIGEPVRAYLIVQRGLSRPAPVAEERLSLPDKPSIAVLPFENMSADPLQEYFSDGITEDIITELSKISGLFVIARHSAFTYKGKSVTLRQVGQELGVRYVLEGSVRRGGNRLRITAQLIDAGTDHHLWAERYDREIEDMFAVQDEVSQKVAEALEIALTPGEQQYVPRPYTDNQEAYDLFLRGRAYQVGSTKERTAESRRLFKKAIALDPNFASAYALLSHTHWRDWRNQWREGSASLELAFHAAEKAVALDNTLPLAHVYLAWVNVFKRQYEQAIAGARRAVSLDPNFAEGYARLGHIDTLAGSSPEEGIEHIRKAMRLDPHYPSNYLIYLGHAYYVMEKYEEAVSALKRAVTRSPDNTHSSLLLALIYTELGDPDMAREHVAEVLRVSPRTTIRSRNEGMPFKDPAMAARFSKALRNSGLPE